MKLNGKIGLLVLLSLAGCIYCPAQDFDFYKKQAYTCFDNGEYEKAQKALNMYNEMTGNKITALSGKVALCLNYQASAKEAEQSGDYASAKSYYESILECNPKDPNASATIARLNALVAALRGKERVVAGESNQPPQEAAASELEFTVSSKINAVKLKKNKTKPLSPKKIGYSLFLLSQFNSKGIIGIGFTVNRSYFQFGSDIALSRGSADLRPNENDIFFNKEAFSKYMELHENKFINPDIQFITNFGVNFNFFQFHVV